MESQPLRKSQTKSLLLHIYDRLERHFGRQNWWPAETPFEVMIGAILTQQTAWKNVEVAIRRLKEDKLLTPKSLANADVRLLQTLVRSAGFYRQKTKRLRDISAYIYSRYGNDISLFWERMQKN